jgi:integrase
MKTERGNGRIYKREGCQFWYAQYYDLNGKIQRPSTGETDERKAYAHLAKLIAKRDVGVAVGTAYERTTLGELIEDVYKNYEVRALRSLLRTKACGAHLTEFFGERRKVKTLSSPELDDYVLMRQKEKASNGTIIRELALLQRAFTLGKRNRKIANPPAVPSLTPPKPREGFLTHPEWLKLHAALPEDLKDPVAFPYLSGWRVGEMKTLRWSDVDRLGKRIVLRPEHSKNGESRTLIFGADGWAIIERAAARQIPTVGEVFTREGRAIRWFYKSWIKARRDAGLPTLKVHDLRRSAIRNLVRAGVPESVAMKCSGHKSATVFQRYNVTSDADIADAMVALEKHLATLPTKTADIVPFRATA